MSTQQGEGGSGGSLSTQGRWRIARVFVIRTLAMFLRQRWIAVCGLIALAPLALVLILKPQGPAGKQAAVATLPANPQEIARKAARGVLLQPIPADRARALNAATPFEPLGPPARAFIFRGSEDDRTRALACLASAMVYEAGGEPGGQEAVAQVVLNRVRHPAYPRTICGVVYQGAQLSTGCQFTFTCDGSLNRRVPQAVWQRTRRLAERFMEGKVDPRVGLATHYHTDWVHPYWSRRLNKIAQVGTHLFFRWSGWWGSAGAFRDTYRGAEPIVDRPPIKREGDPATLPEGPPDLIADPILADDLTTAPRPLGDIALPPGMAQGSLRGSRLVLSHPDGGAYGLLVAADAQAQDLISTALRLCAGQGFCSVMAWSDATDIPRGFPVPPQARARAAFEYRRDPSQGTDGVVFDCARYPRSDSQQCRKS